MPRPYTRPPRPLAVARTATAPDHDYTAGFAALVAAEAALARDPAPKHLLLRAQARLAVGDELGAAFDAERLLRCNALVDDAQCVKGEAMLTLARRASAREAGPDPQARAEPRRMRQLRSLPPRDDLLRTAVHCLGTVVQRQPLDGHAAHLLAVAHRELDATAFIPPGNPSRPPQTAALGAAS